MSRDFWWIFPIGVLVPVVLTVLTEAFRRFAKAEARRVEVQVGSDTLQVANISREAQQKLIKRFAERAASTAGDGKAATDLSRFVEETSHLAEESATLDEHTRLVLRYYAQGVGQAQVSFYFSLTFASVGFMVIVSGVVLAILRPDSSVQTAVTVGAGVVTDAIGALFFTLANRSRSVMTTFIDKLRLDREREREFLKSLELIELIDSNQLRDSLKAIAALRFLRAESDINALPGFPQNPHLKVATDEKVPSSPAPSRKL